MRFYKKLYFEYILFFGIVAFAFALFSAFRVFGLGVDYKGYLEIFYGNSSTEPVFRILK